MENKKMPLQLMALTKQDDGFLVSLQLSGSETGFSLRQISSGQLQAGFQGGKGKLEVLQVMPQLCNHMMSSLVPSLLTRQVDHIEEGSWLDGWNDQVAGQRCQLPWTSEVPKVLPGSRILEVEGLVGAQAATVQRQAQHKLRMTVALRQPEEEELLPPVVPPVASCPSPLPATPATVLSPTESLPLGGPGFRWLALWDRIKGKKGQGTDTEEVCQLKSGDIVVQANDWKRTSNGLIRMPIRRTKHCPRDCVEVWVTLDARDAGPGGKVFFKPFEHFGSTGCLWRCKFNGVKIRSTPEMTSDICGEIHLNDTVIQAKECQWVAEVLRLPIQGRGQVGWVTLDARCKGGPLFFDFMGPLEGGLWQATTAVRSLDSPVVVNPKEIVVQKGPWKKLADGKLLLPIQSSQGLAWVTLLSDASDQTSAAWFELVGMDRTCLDQTGYVAA